MRWQTWACLGLGLWGLWGFAVARASALGLTTWGTLAGLVLVEGLMVAPRLAETQFSWWIMLGGITGVAAYYCLVAAARESPSHAAAAVAISGAYPVLTTVLLVACGWAELRWQTVVAVLLVSAALVVVNV